MLYVTTRNNRDVFTVNHVLTGARGADGGQFLPFRHPRYSTEEIAALGQESFNETVAGFLNRLFRTKLTRWDVDFAIGRYPARLRELGQRIFIGECWHNPQWNFDRTVWQLAGLLNAQELTDAGSWVEIGIRMAVLFGLYGEMQRSGQIEAGEKIDISAVSGEMSLILSAWYARQWGLPVGNIICCCNENSEIWNLVCHGQFRTDVVCIPTSTKDADVTRPVCLERLIHGCGGEAEVKKYLSDCERGGMYVPSDRTLENIRDGLFVSVISSRRTERTIPGVYHTHEYLMSPYTALAYEGLLDYRAKKGQLRHSIVIAERSALTDAQAVSGCLGIPVRQISELM